VRFVPKKKGVRTTMRADQLKRTSDSSLAARTEDGYKNLISIQESRPGNSGRESRDSPEKVPPGFG